MSHTKEEVLAKARQIAQMMGETEEVEFFKRAEKQIDANGKVSEIIAQMKALQKQAVNLQHFGKKQALAEVEAKIEALESTLYAMPIVEEFQVVQQEVNELLQMVSQTIVQRVDETTK